MLPKKCDDTFGGDNSASWEGGINPKSISISSVIKKGFEILPVHR